MTGRKALRRFLTALQEAPDGTGLEIGLMWDTEQGWRVYNRVGKAVLMLDPKSARGLHRAYRKAVTLKEWGGGRTGLEVMDSLLPLADEAEANNRSGRVPPDDAIQPPIIH